MKIESWLRIESKFNKGIYYLPPLLPSPNQKKKKNLMNILAQDIA